MNKEDYLQDNYKSLEEAPLYVLEEHKGNILAILEDFGAAGDQKRVNEEEEELKRVRELISRRRENKLCGRYTAPYEGHDLEIRFENSKNVGFFEKTWNAAPGQMLPVVRHNGFQRSCAVVVPLLQVSHFTPDQPEKCSIAFSAGVVNLFLYHIL